MNFRTATCRKIKTLIKQGHTSEELCERFECTEEELEEHIRLLFKAGSDGVLRDLDANRKKARPKPHEEVVEEVTESSDLESVTTPEQERPTDPSIDELRAREQNLSDKVMSLEVSHEELKGKRRAILKSLRGISEELEGLERQAQSCRDRATKLVAQADEIASAMNDISDKRRDVRLELDIIRKKIEERSTVSIYVYADGHIGTPDNQEFVLDDDGYLALKDELLARDECLDIRVRDVVTLARVKIISEKSTKFSLVFEDQTLESVFFALFTEKTD